MFQTLEAITDKDGRLHILGDVNLPKSRRLLITILDEQPIQPAIADAFTAVELLASDLIGLWEHRDDIDDSTTYAQQLRRIAERRPHIEQLSDDTARQ